MTRHYGDDHVTDSGDVRVGQWKGRGQTVAGRPGRSGGHNKKSLLELQASGGFRADRHAHLLPKSPVEPSPAVNPLDRFLRRREGVQPLIPPASEAGWQPTRGDLAALGTHGKTFVRSMIVTFEFAATDGLVLLEAGHALDEVTRWRERSRREDAHNAQGSRLTLGWQRQFAALLQQLKGSR
ncbi:MAG: hypothetical protein ABJA98_22095 [Acidobacteriota bacterium]